MEWKLCPFFCREDEVHGYQKCIRERVIPEYIAFGGRQMPYCRHMDFAMLRVSRSQNNPFRPYLPVEKEMILPMGRQTTRQ